MTPSFEDLKEYAKEAREVADKMKRLADDLDDAAEDRISPNDCDLSGAYAAESFVCEIVPMLMRF